MPHVLIFLNNLSPGVRLLVGPIVGIVTNNSARLLLEATATGEVSVNVFSLTSSSSEGRFMFKKVGGLCVYPVDDRIESFVAEFLSGIECSESRHNI